MVIKRGGLGRNLTALLSHADTSLLPAQQSTAVRTTLTMDCLQPGKYQPRAEIHEETLKELAASIAQQGLLQPLVVREISPGHFEIIAGERRWRACQLVGLTEVPVILRQVDDETAMAMALVENLQREDLNAMDQARAMHRLTTEFELTHQQIADLLCKSRTAVSNYLRLLNLSDEVRRLLEQGDLEMGHARCLLALDEAQQHYVARLIVEKELSVREAENLAHRVKLDLPSPEKQSAVTSIYHDEIQALASKLNTQIRLKHRKTGQGTLIIHYDNPMGLQKMIDQLASYE